MKQFGIMSHWGWTIFLVILLGCKTAPPDSVETLNDVQLEEDEDPADSTRLIIKKIGHTEANGFRQLSVRIEISSYGEVMQSFQELFITFGSIEKLVFGEKIAYFISCDRQGSTWAAKKAIIVWDKEGIWSILPLHFDRATLHKNEKRFLIDEKIGVIGENPTGNQLYEFNDGLLTLYKP